jgi:Uma2 family endonuclease
MAQAPSFIATFSDDEFDEFVRRGAFGDLRLELRRGYLHRMSPQHVPHGFAKREIARALERAIATANWTWTVDTELSVRFGGGFTPMPDVVVWAGTADPLSHSRPVLGTEVALIVEVADTTLADDLGEKLEDCARSGLAEYWVADVVGRQVLVHPGPTATGYATRTPVALGGTASWRGVTVDLSALR